MQVLRAPMTFVVPLMALFTLTAATAAPEDTALKAAVADTARAPQSAARDQYRHPYETLSFWGLKPRQTVLEIYPGGGYWSEILAPYAKASGGTYAATVPDLTGASEQAVKGTESFKARFADETKYGKVRWQTWNGKSGALGAAGSVDIVITARNLHNWMWTPGLLDGLLKDFNAVLKPGGILAVEDHRADPRQQVPEARDGYVSTAFIIAAAEKAGFKLEASSEANANPKDTKDHPFGVWTLHPTNRKDFPAMQVSWAGRPGADKLRAPEAYQAIGESDRMTLRFRKQN